LLWALLNGIITGGVLVGIVLVRRQRREAAEQLRLLGEVRRHLDDRENLETRVAALEERLDFAERMLTMQRENLPLPPSRDG
jgi:hypothetical protein